MLTQPANFKTIIHFWEDKQVFPSLGNTVVLKKQPKEKSVVSQCHKDSTLEAECEVCRHRRLDPSTRWAGSRAIFANLHDLVLPFGMS